MNEPTPRSIYGLSIGDEWWVVQHNDNSDHGRCQVFFPVREEALDYADDTEANPPAGNHFHPAPATLDIRVFAVERIR
jgi:hypothetical protein